MARQRRKEGRRIAERARRLAHPERVRAQLDRYQKAHPEALRQAGRVRRARKRGAFVAPVNEREIFERDRWVCQLCRKRVNKRLKYPHPMCASIDHIIPLSLGGTEEPANVHLAHLVCNERKHVRAMGEQTRLL